MYPYKNLKQWVASATHIATAHTGKAHVKKFREARGSRTLKFLMLQAISLWSDLQSSKNGLITQHLKTACRREWFTMERTLQEARHSSTDYVLAQMFRTGVAPCNFILCFYRRTCRLLVNLVSSLVSPVHFTCVYTTMSYFLFVLFHLCTHSYNSLCSEWYEKMHCSTLNMKNVDRFNVYILPPICDYGVKFLSFYVTSKLNYCQLNCSAHKTNVKAISLVYKV